MTIRLDANLIIDDSPGRSVIRCSHCHCEIAGAEENYKEKLPMHEGQPAEAGPHIFDDPALFVDQTIVFRQYYCPGCFTALATEIVPAGQGHVHEKKLAL